MMGRKSQGGRRGMGLQRRTKRITPRTPFPPSSLLPSPYLVPSPIVFKLSSSKVGKPMIYLGGGHLCEVAEPCFLLEGWVGVHFVSFNPVF